MSVEFWLSIVNLVLVITVFVIMVIVLFKVSTNQKACMDSIKVVHSNMQKLVNEINHVNNTEYQVDSIQQESIINLRGMSHSH